MAEYDLNFKDFSLPEAELQPKRFKIGTEQFTAPAQISVLAMARLVTAGQQITQLGESLQTAADTDDITKAAADLEALLTGIGDIFVELLNDDDQSGQRFKAGILRKQNAIDLYKQVVPVIRWLLEVYGLRPTEASSASSNGSEDAGPGSTDGAANGESTP